MKKSICQWCGGTITDKVERKYHGLQSDKNSCAYKAQLQQGRRARNESVKKDMLRDMGYDVDADIGWLNG